MSCRRDNSWPIHSSSLGLSSLSSAFFFHEGKDQASHRVVSVSDQSGTRSSFIIDSEADPFTTGRSYEADRDDRQEAGFRSACLRVNDWQRPEDDFV